MTIEEKVCACIMAACLTAGGYWLGARYGYESSHVVQLVQPPRPACLTKIAIQKTVFDYSKGICKARARALAAK